MLITLHDILWPSFYKWKKLTFEDIIDDSQLKKIIIKSIKIFHPDRNRDLSSERLYVCERVVSELNNAYKDYRKKF